MMKSMSQTDLKQKIEKKNVKDTNDNKLYFYLMGRTSLDIDFESITPNAFNFFSFYVLNS